MEGGSGELQGRGWTRRYGEMNGIGMDDVKSTKKINKKLKTKGSTFFLMSHIYQLGNVFVSTSDGKAK